MKVCDSVYLTYLSTHRLHCHLYPSTIYHLISHLSCCLFVSGIAWTGAAKCGPKMESWKIDFYDFHSTEREQQQQSTAAERKKKCCDERTIKWNIGYWICAAVHYLLVSSAEQQKNKIRLGTALFRR